MESGSYALVLTGEVLPGHSPEAVWPALAAYFRMDADRFESQLRARAPLAIKHSDELGKLQTLQAGAAAVGAESEICAPDDRPALFLLLDGKARGPVPRVLVEERVEHGLWPATMSVAAVGTKDWKPYRMLDAVVTPAPPPRSEPLPEKPFHAGDIAVTPVPRSTVATSPSLVLVLPDSETVHAGFWRRCAAMIIDGLLIGLALALVQAVLSFAVIGTLGTGGEGFGALVSVFGLMSLLSLVIQWLYFALFESGSAQATPGKRVLGIKVVDDRGRRIGFGRASGRFLGKILSGALLGIGYLMAGWTERKRALHDMVADTCVVFSSVEYGRPMPTERVPMPWYGWLVNVVGLGAVPLLVGVTLAGLAW